GQITGAQLVKQMFGEVESVLTLASGQQNLLEAVAKAEFNKRGGSFVAAEGRIVGDPAVKAGAVVEVDKAGQRVNGQYYVTGADHLFFADTGYATEFRARRYAIKKQSSPAKDLAKFAKAVQEAAKKALQTAHEAAANVVDLAKNAYQHAQDAFDAVKAAALDAIHTTGDQEGPLSGPVQGMKKSLLAAAETALAAGKAGMTLANAAIVKGKSAIEMCAAKAHQMAKSLIEGIGGDLSKVIDSVKQSGNASNQSILGAISSGAQHALDQAKKAVSQAQDAIAKAKEAVKEAQK